MVLTAGSASACTIKIHNDPGGAITTYEERLDDYNRRGCVVELSGLIQSSATLYLGATYVCLKDPMTAQFHGPSWGGLQMAPVDFQYWKHRLSEPFPRGIQIWYRAVVRDHTTIWTIKRAELIRLGVPSCDV